MGDFIVTDRMMLWAMAIAGVGFGVAHFLITATSLNRRIRKCLLEHPDEAYDFFCADTQHWTLYLAPVSSVLGQHRGERRAAFRTFPPLEFQVPKLQNRTVSVFGARGKGEECGRLLVEFIAKKNKPPTPDSQTLSSTP